ncbi:uncharacterized protein LOC112682560 [Sipha flava]|uniref:ATP-dependent DNA helicase n=1 Tax=Sipha flava TaxID=143950 RepID=A0A8B8FDL1_9HEMI|nr:uncharacterized protein LOC112682560 [Sipha flava]
MRLWKSKVHSGMAYDPDIAYRTDTSVALGSMTYKCQWCNAFKWKDETLGMCCSAGKVQLEKLKQLPEPLYSLVNTLHPDHVKFMNNIRKYNACFQMTSFGGKQVTADGFLPTFKVKGQVYHLIGSILPEPGQGAQYFQIYFVGEEEREHHITPDQIDNVICAEIPDPISDPQLHEIVECNMIHGPCSCFNRNSPCMKDNACSKHYPKNLIKETQTGDDGYPKCKRRSTDDGGFSVNIKGVDIDNRWIVPYNPVLLRTCNAHVNVEYCSSVKSIKYVCKYVNKGSDQASFALENEKDEIKTYESGRYINSSEAVRRILEFPIHELDDFAKNLLCPEVPAYYVWDKKKFQRRKRGVNFIGWPDIKREHALGRVYTVHPNNTECYHLRMLLHEIRGPISFEALKTVNGQVYPTFKSTCKALGLLEDDEHFYAALEETALCQSPHMIRDLFTIILVFCQVTDPLYLWDKFKEYLSEDFKIRLERQDSVDAEHLADVALNKCLSIIEDSVLALGGQPLSQANLNNLIIENAPGGTGKTFLTNLILAKVRSTRDIALAVASSGIAATLLEGGRTAHATFKLPPNLTTSATPFCNISKQSNFAEVLKDTKLIVWDEITMAHKGGVEALNRSLKDIRENKRLMGGVTVLLAGDFRQTLPVVPKGTRTDEVKSCLKRSTLWPKINILKLSKNMRVHLGEEKFAGGFSDLLLEIGNVVTAVQDLISKIYPDIAHIHDNPMEWLCEHTILTSKNDQAAVINDTLLMSFKGEEKVYTSIDTLVNMDDATNYPVEFLNSFKPPVMPYHRLILRVGTPIMLLRNLKPPKLCNGTRLKVKALHRNIVEATILTGCAKGETVFVPRIPLIPNDHPFEFKRLQFPLKVCFAMTINKSQGQTLKFAGIDLRENCFSHGQFYVAYSRVSSLSSLVILSPTNRSVKNIVYKEVLKITY